MKPLYLPLTEISRLKITINTSNFTVVRQYKKYIKSSKEYVWSSDSDDMTLPIEELRMFAEQMARAEKLLVLE